MPERYAIYYAPPTASALWQRAAQWLSRDAAGVDPEPVTIPGIEPARRMAVTTSARRYGFHGTIKAPMILPGHQTVAELEAALAAYTLKLSPIPLGKLEVRLLGGFLAIMPIEQPKAIKDFAADVTEAFEPFRAPVTAEERARRTETGLTPRQIELLDRYGYPYVMEHFIFHMTIGDRLVDDDRDLIIKAAKAWFAPVLDEALVVDRMTLFHEPREQAAFVRRGDFPLASEARV